MLACCQVWKIDSPFFTSGPMTSRGVVYLRVSYATRYHDLDTVVPTQDALQSVDSKHQHVHKYKQSDPVHCYRSSCIELTASLNSLGPLAWVKLSEEQVCFTIIPEQGTQVWA